MLVSVAPSVICSRIADRASGRRRLRACVLPLDAGEEPPVHEHPLIRKLESQGLALSEEEVAALLAMPMQVETLRADQDIVREGDRPTRSCLLLDGYAATYKTTPAGKRQI